MRTFWIKPETVRGAVFPQLPSFCGVAVCCGAANALLGADLTQERLHEEYGIGGVTKLLLPPGPLPADLASRPRVGRGMSNWDVIRLFNSVLLDAGGEPHAAVLCGADFVREAGDETRFERLLDWARTPSSQVVVHLVNHYVLLAGLLETAPGAEPYLLAADPSRRKGPLRSLSLTDVRTLATGDERYGWILLSDRPIPEDLFSGWTDAMLPREARYRERFARTGPSR